MPKPYPDLFSLQQLVSDLSLVKRNHHVLNSAELENDIEHSFTVALLCWYLVEHLKLKLDISLVLKYAMAHDFVEIYAGDVNTFAIPEARKRKIEREKLSLARLSAEFKSFPDLINTMNGYEKRQDDESLFVWSVDKMQAFILGDLDDWRPYKKIGVTYENFVATHEGQLANGSPYAKKTFKAVLEYCKTTYYDRPNI